MIADDAPTAFGPFLLLRRLGGGARASVYVAHQEDPERLVAIKILTAGRLADAEARCRFAREVALVGRLRHPHVLTVHDAGVVDGAAYYTMDYVAGEDLAARLHRDGLERRALVDVLVAVADALHYAHEQGIVHRDVKPSNVLLDERGWPFLADFGLARDLLEADDLTASHAAVGTPHYMAPEQARGERDRIDRRTDVYALGVVLYEALTCRTPHAGPSPLAVLRRVAAGEPAPPPSRLRPGLERDLEAICLRCLEPVPERRYPTAAALADDLRALVAGRPVAARRRGPIERAAHTARRHWRALGAAALVVGLAFAATVLALGRRADAGLAVLNEAIDRLQQLEQDPLAPDGLPELRRHREASAGWSGWPALLRERAAAAADEHQLWWLALRFLDQAPDDAETWARRAELRARVGRLDAAAAAWREAARRGRAGAATLAALASELAEREDFPIRAATGDVTRFVPVDLDGDGIDALVVVEIGREGPHGAVLHVLERGAAARVVALPDELATRAQWRWLYAWDADGDGREEIVAGVELDDGRPHPESETLVVLEAAAAGRALVEHARVAFGAATSFATSADVDADGRADLLVPKFYYERGVLVCAPGTGGAEPACAVVAGREGADLWQADAGDLDGDGAPELHVATGCTTGYAVESFVRGSGGWRSARRHLLGLVTGVAVAPWRDGRPELVAAVSTTPFIRELGEGFARRGFAGLVGLVPDGRSGYREVWQQSLSMSPGGRAHVRIAGTWRAHDGRPWLAVLAGHGPSPWDCCNRAKVLTTDLVARDELHLRLLAGPHVAVAELDGDPGAELVFPLQAGPPGLRALGVAGGADGRAAAPEPDDPLERIARHRVELAPLVPPDGVALDLNVAAELLWDRPVFAARGDASALARLDRVLARLGREPSLDAAATPLAPPAGARRAVSAQTRSWEFTGGLPADWHRPDPQRAAGSASAERGWPVRWTAAESFAVVSPVVAEAGASFALEAVLRVDALAFGQRLHVELHREDADAGGGAGLGVFLQHVINCSRPGGPRHRVEAVLPGAGCRLLHRRPPQASFHLGLPQEIRIAVDAERRRASLRVHPAGSDPETEAVLDAELIDCALPAGRYRVRIAAPEVAEDADGGAEVWIRSVRLEPR